MQERWERQVQSPGGEDPLEEGTTTYSSILAWSITWIEELDGLQSMVSVELDTTSMNTMAPHSSTLAWKILWMEEPGGLQSMGSWRVGHDWATSLSLFTFMHWGRKWQPTPVFLPGESQGWQSLVGLWGRRVGHDWSDSAAAACTQWDVQASPQHTETICYRITFIFLKEIFSGIIYPALAWLSLNLIHCCFLGNVSLIYWHLFHFYSFWSFVFFHFIFSSIWK